MIAGAGVACATDKDNECASWTGLLKNGLVYCKSRCHTLQDTWFSTTKSLIDEQAADSLIDAASRIEKALRGVHDGVYARWLNDSVGSLKLVDRSIVDAILDLGTRIVTTNYDNLFELASQRLAVVWSEHNLAMQVLRGDNSGILHLHGHFQYPVTVVFGSKTYADICRDSTTQSYLKSTFALNTIVFVGCGAGVEDPNFGGLFEWSEDVFKDCLHTHYQLVRESDLAKMADKYSGLNIALISYGKEYSDLSPFLVGIKQRVSRKSHSPSPLDTLVTTQNDYKSQIKALADRKDVSATEFVRCNFEIAKALWNSGGRRVASLHMDSILSLKGKELTSEERIYFTLDAAEYLLDDGNYAYAAILIDRIEKDISNAAGDQKILAQFQRLLLRCHRSSANLDELLKVIETALINAAPELRSRLEAERAELHFLSGNLEVLEQYIELESK